MVIFCENCGAYIPPGRKECQSCKHTGQKTAKTRKSTKPAIEFKQLKPDELTIEEVLKYFPSRKLRKYQEETMEKMVDAFNEGKKCIILALPTGAGKSYLLTAFTSLMKSFYATPQLALIDQINRDPNLQGRFVEMKGRANYKCFYQPSRGVHVGKCETEGYDCTERFQVCPYWIQKIKAGNASSVLLSLAYLTSESQTEGFSETYLGSRPLLVLDEAHNIEEQCLNQIALRIAPFSVPHEIYNKFLPRIRKVKDKVQVDELLDYFSAQMADLKDQIEHMAAIGGMSLALAEDKRLIDQFLFSYKLYRSSSSEWVWQTRNDQLMLQPIFAKDFMKQLLWKRGENYIISSATILNPPQYIRLAGLLNVMAEDEIVFLQTPSTFPVKNRPIIDATVGLLSRAEWDKNMPKAVTEVENILRVERGSVAIHCSAYVHQKALLSYISDEFRPRLITHGSNNREEKLKEWMRSPGKVFVSVAFNEGQDWKYDLCLLPEEKIMTSRGIKKICEIRIGDEVLTHKCRFRKVISVKVRDYDGDVTSIRPYYSSKPFTVTAEHQILTNRGWVKASQITRENIAYPKPFGLSDSTPRMYISYEIRRPGFHKYENRGQTANYFRDKVRLRRVLTPSDMRLCGYYLAEGVTNSSQVKLCFGKDSSELTYAEDAAHLFEDIFHRKATIANKGNGYMVTFGSVEAAKWFKERFGKKAPVKKMPFSFLRASREHCIELLKGYFRGDGSHYENIFRARTTSETLAYQMKLLLARFGLVATVSLRKKRGKEKIQSRVVSVNDCYEISTSRTQAAQVFDLLGVPLTLIRKRRFKVKATHSSRLFKTPRYLYHKIHTKSSSHYSGTVYNLEVEDDNSYVGASSIFHNCSAQILFKVPFPDLSDVRVKKRLDMGYRQWYSNQAMLAVIQAYGRAIRADDDKARFYVIDGSIKRLIQQCWPFIPDWFKEALPDSFREQGSNSVQGQSY